jgi:hypothetical protein
MASPGLFSEGSALVVHDAGATSAADQDGDTFDRPAFSRGQAAAILALEGPP